MVDVANRLMVEMAFKDSATPGIQRFGSEIGRTFGLASSQARELGQSVGGISSLMSGLSFGGLALLTVGLAKLTEHFFESSKEAEKLSGELETLALSSGISLERLKEISSGMAEFGVKSETTVSILEKLEDAQERAAKGINTTSAAFKSLGVDIRDAKGELVDIDKVLAQIIFKVSTSRNNRDLQRDIKEIFGRDQLKEFNALMESLGGMGASVRPGVADPLTMLKQMKAEAKAIEDQTKADEKEKIHLAAQLNSIEKDSLQTLEKQKSPEDQLLDANQKKLDTIQRGLDLHVLTTEEFIKQRDEALAAYEVDKQSLQAAKDHLEVERLKASLKQKWIEEEKKAAQSRGFTDSFDLLIDKFKETNVQAEAATEVFKELRDKGIGGIAQGFVDATSGIKSFGASLKVLFLEIARDIERILIEMLLLSSIRAALGGEGGITSGILAGNTQGQNPPIGGDWLGNVGFNTPGQARIGGRATIVNFKVYGDAESFRRQEQQVTQMIQRAVSTSVPLRAQLRGV